MRKRRTLGRRTALAAGAALLASPAIRARAATNGVALVIGNSKYHWEASLPNVRRDAPDIAKRFQAMGLQTDLQQDLGLGAMKAAMDKFVTALSSAEFAAFYFAGHGASFEKSTYLVPVDADLSDPSTVTKLIDLPRFRTALAPARNRMLILDNCRNNPADGWRQRDALDQAGGFADPMVQEAPNTLVLFSTAPGRVALDGPAGENSPFAATLLRQFDSGSVDLQALPGKLRRDLLIATQGRQVLWDRSTFSQPFMLSGAARGQSGGRAGGWAADPSKIVELTSAYAFAQQNNLVLPAGLIAHRPASSSKDSQKIGSFKFTGPSREPSLLIVMSVEEQQSAEIIIATRAPNGKTGWRFIRGTLQGDALDFFATANGARFNFAWRDANSGSVGAFNLGPNRNGMMNGSFARLDG